MSERLNEAVEIKDSVTRCRLCFHLSSSDANMKLGPLYQYVVDPETEVYCAHLFCLFFSSGLVQNGGDDDGIKGFLPVDILKEWRRGQRLKCQFCDKNYATIGCVHKRCQKSYHLPCAMKNGVLLQYVGNFNSYCLEHRPQQKITFKKEGARRECGVCLENIFDHNNENNSDDDDEISFKYPPLKKKRKDTMKPSHNAIWTPCCGSWVHRCCVQTYAESAGYFFKCPLCKDANVFPEEMKKFGVFVPEQDASWERVPNAFQELLERHGTCDAEICACPKGRNFDEDYTPWEIVLCRICGSSGVHISCGRLKSASDDNPKWTCDLCSTVEKRLPVHHFKRLKFGSNATRKGSSKIGQSLQSLQFNITEDSLLTVSISKSSVSIRLPISNRVSVPNPVQVTKSETDAFARLDRSSPSTADPLVNNHRLISDYNEEDSDDDSEEDEEVSFPKQMCMKKMKSKKVTKQALKQPTILQYFQTKSK